jgi:hypothetical protein
VGRSVNDILCADSPKGVGVLPMKAREDPWRTGTVAERRQSPRNGPSLLQSNIDAPEGNGCQRRKLLAPQERGRDWPPHPPSRAERAEIMPGTAALRASQ